MIDVYGDRRSGNCLKVLWLLQALGRPYRWRDVDVLGGGARTPAFRALNIAGQVPVVAFQDGRTLAQSNAILLHLAEGGPLIPSEPHDRAAMFQWLFWEQYSHEPFLAVRRFQKVYQGHADADIEPRLLAKGLEALEVMETHLRDRAWFAGRRPSLADLALLPYTRFAPDGGFDLAGFPNVRGWVARALAAFGVEDPAVVLPAEPRSPSPEADATFTGYGPDAAAAFCDRWLPAWTGGDAARLAEFYTDDAVYADPARPDGVVGRAALLLYFDRLLARFPDWVWTHDRSPPIPHGFVNFWTCRLADPERAFSGVCLVQLRNGRIFRNEVFFDPSALKRTPDA